MKQLKKKFLFGVMGIPALALAFGLVLSACGDGAGGSFTAVTDITNIPVISIKNLELPLSGTVVPDNATNQTITWSGTNVINGKFKATTTGDYYVTATIANGKSETSPYVKTFKITVANGSASGGGGGDDGGDGSSAEIEKLQGSWTKEITDSHGSVTQTMTLVGCEWTIDYTFGEPGDPGEPMTVCKGIIINVEAGADGTKHYACQVNSVLWGDGQQHPYYSYETGTYTFDNDDTPTNFTLTTAYTTSGGELDGTWTKEDD